MCDEELEERRRLDPPEVPFPAGVEDLWINWPDVLMQPAMLKEMLDGVCYSEDCDTFPEEMKQHARALIPLLETIIEG